VDIDGKAGTTTLLADVNDKFNTINLEGFSPADGGNWDVRIAPEAQSTRVNVLNNGGNYLRAKKLNPSSKIDRPNSVRGIERIG